MKASRALKSVAVLDLLGFGGLGDDLHVDQERQHVFLLGRGVHLREAGPEFLLGKRDVALADFGAVHLGEHRVGVFGAQRQARRAEPSQDSRWAAEARRARGPDFASDDEVVMENPYLESHMAVAVGLFGAARHSPNHVALATRKVCQNDEIPERQARGFASSWRPTCSALPRGFGTLAISKKRHSSGVRNTRFRAPRTAAASSQPRRGVDKPLAQPYLCET